MWNFKRIHSIPLFKEDGTTPFKRKNISSKGMLHKNKDYILWFSGKTWHKFDRKTGRRLLKESVGEFIVFYNRKIQDFCIMDIDCYSYLKVRSIPNYRPEAQKIKNDIEMPILLEDDKKYLINMLKKADTKNDLNTSRPSLDLLRRAMGISN